MQNRAVWLHETMIELADAGRGEFDESVYVGNFAKRLAELLRPAEVCVLLLTDSGEAAASGGPGDGETAALLAGLEAGGTAGPCTSCYRTGQAIRQLPLAGVRSRWPVFAAAAEVAGLTTCWALPMRHSAEAIGAVSMLTAGDRVIRPEDLRLARALTELSTITVLGQRELRETQRLARQLQHALDSRILIEQAKGAVSAYLGMTPDEAFGLLRSYARARSRPLSRLAREVVDGIVPATSLLGGGSTADTSGSRQRNGAQDTDGGASHVRSGLSLPSAAPPRHRSRPAGCTRPCR